LRRGRAILKNELTVRPDRGSDALHFVRWRGSRQEYDWPRLVILVHGFNTSEKKARNSYKKFLTNLGVPSDDRIGTWSHGRISRAFWGFYWPGDHSSLPISILSAPQIYGERRGTAETSGESLAELVMHLSDTQEIILVGHSLGCRVVLEAVRRIAIAREIHGRTGGAQITSVCLMAAAVPIGDCHGDEAPYRRRDGEPKELVLFSGHDMVLRPGYGIAEWFYDSQKGPAVGATGLPEDRWKDSSLDKNTIDTELGHRHYWDSKRSADYVGDFLAGIPIREATARAGPEQRGREQQRRTQDIRDMDTRDVGDVCTLEWQNCFDPP
jgi:pimeloyl-ACP methyl ester carboxylesterase